MIRFGPLQPTETWKYALIGGLLALPFTALGAWRSPAKTTLGMVVVGSVLAGITHLGGAVFSPLLVVSIPTPSYYLYRRHTRLERL